MNDVNLTAAALGFSPSRTTRYNSANDFFRRAFGKKVYKLAFDAGMTCPNRDGTIGKNGCIFCSEGGSGDFAERITPENADSAFDSAKARIRDKSDADSFIAYFQSYTNTYAPPEKLDTLFTPIINRKEVCALSIATRPDCIETAVYELIARLCKIKPVFVELGLQTSDEQSAKFIRRGYENAVFVTAAQKLKAAGANVITHVILGLPNETRTQMLESVKFAAEYSDGIKLQLLHVLKGTDLAGLYAVGEFKTLDRDEYISILCDCVNALPEKTVIHRLTGDAPKKLLISPEWSADKKSVLNAIKKRFDENDVLQGSLAHRLF